ncbi:tetratricopeptide repeat protein [Verticiella sediminum]|uniref:Tetratricopeptide repeat protein n=1 Tax=Verticiella sediminum TaxID=1247510 RepID=A0A556AUP6_9BURK|nr:tetratricopeptide repeat protein [Verticiella sediminum]TSH96663.1 tetratricopeptide repeat protein [Verticiella sediminum]
MLALPHAPRRLLRRSLAALAFVCAAPLVSAQTTQADIAAQEPYGWPWLVRALDRLKPSTDTRLPETPTETVQRLESMVNQGRSADALREIEDLQAKRAASNVSGVDARLLFLQARALAAQGRLDDAQAIYQRMTTDFPELPEPWNNLAAIHAAQGRLDEARNALDMALVTDPNYGPAKTNLADIYLMLANRSYRDAARMGQAEAAKMAARTQELLIGISH